MIVRFHIPDDFKSDIGCQTVFNMTKGSGSESMSQLGAASTIIDGNLVPVLLGPPALERT